MTDSDEVSAAYAEGYHEGYAACERDFARAGYVRNVTVDTLIERAREESNEKHGAALSRIATALGLEATAGEEEIGARARGAFASWNTLASASVTLRLRFADAWLGALAKELGLGDAGALPPDALAAAADYAGTCLAKGSMFTEDLAKRVRPHLLPTLEEAFDRYELLKMGSPTAEQLKEARDAIVAAARRVKAKDG